MLCVGLVCLDLVTVVDKFPKEDTDMRSSAQYKVTSPPTTLTKSLLKGNTPLSRSVEGTRTTAAGFSQSLVSQPPSSAALLVRCTPHHLTAPVAPFFTFLHLAAPYPLSVHASCSTLSFALFCTFHLLHLAAQGDADTEFVLHGMEEDSVQVSSASPR